MSERFTVEVDITAKDKTSKALGTAKRGFKDAFNEIASGALRRAGEGLTDFAKQIPGMVVDLANLGVEVNTAQRRFTQFAGGADRAAMFMDAFNEGTDNTVDKMAAMSSAGRLLQMGLVETGDEMSQISSIATKLGDQTMGAGDRIADFSALLANQSIPRLDNFGISSGRVRQRINELLASGKALNREEAFKMAVMEEGAKALERLGDTSDLASVQLDKLKASWQTARQELGQLIAEDAAEALETFSVEGKSADEMIRGLIPWLRAYREEVRNTTFAQRPSNEEIRASREEHLKNKAAMEQTREATRAMQIDLVTGTISREQYNQAIEETMRAMDDAAISSLAYYNRQQLLEATTGVDSSQAFNQYQDAIEAAQEAQDRAMYSSMKFEEQLTLQAEAAMNTAEAHLGLAQSYTDYEKDATRIAEDNTEKREEIEAKHQAALAEIAKKGQSVAVKFNEAAEVEKLNDLQWRMDQAARKLAEMTGKEKESARLAKEKALADAQESYAEQQQLLDDFHAGRLVTKGQNVDALLAEEDRQYQESLAKLEESQAEQEQAQKESLGRMTLAHFNAWVEMNLAADGFTQEESQFVTEMRNKISLEYGLITQSAVDSMTEQEEEWKQTMAIMTGEATGFFDYFMQRFDSLPSEKVMTIRTELANPPKDVARNEGGPGTTGEFKQHGGQIMVGEAGPEIITVQPLGGNTYNDTYNIYDGRAMSAVQERKRRERRAELARTM